MTFDLSRRRFFVALPGWIGVAGCDSALQPPVRQDAGSLVLRHSAAGSVDLNSTAEQAIDIPHGSIAKPTIAKVVLIDVLQDDPTVDTTALRWARGYPVYDEAASTITEARVLVKFAALAGFPATGRARILFELPAAAAGPA